MGEGRQRFGPDVAVLVDVWVVLRGRAGWPGERVGIASGIEPRVGVDVMGGIGKCDGDGDELRKGAGGGGGGGIVGGGNGGPALIFACACARSSAAACAGVCFCVCVWMRAGHVVGLAACAPRAGVDLERDRREFLAPTPVLSARMVGSALRGA